MLAQEQEKLAGGLAVKAAEVGVKAFAGRIIKAIKAKDITLEKVLRIYVVVDKAVKDIEAIVNEK